MVGGEGRSTLFPYTTLFRSRDVVAARPVSKRRPLILVLAGQLIDGRSHLPVAILAGAFEGRFDVRTLEVGQRHDPPPPYRSLVFECAQHCGPPAVVANGP